jgi:hypothetical protein
VSLNLKNGTVLIGFLGAIVEVMTSPQVKEVVPPELWPWIVIAAMVIKRALWPTAQEQTVAVPAHQNDPSAPPTAGS